MPEFTATASPETATVELRISDVAGVTGILRSDVNGTRPVRLRKGDLPSQYGKVFTDYEASLSGPVLYRLQGSMARSEAWTAISQVAAPRFIIPSIPQFSVSVESITEYSAERKSTVRFHEVINRSSPLVAEGRMGTRTGDLVAIFRSYAAAADLENMLERGQTVMLRQQEQPGLDMYFNCFAARLQADPDKGVWEVRISFTEVSFPAGHVLSGAGWTFAALAEKFPDFDAVATSYDTFHDLTIGEAK